MPVLNIQIQRRYCQRSSKAHKSDQWHSLCLFVRRCYIWLITFHRGAVVVVTARLQTGHPCVAHVFVIYNTGLKLHDHYTRGQHAPLLSFAFYSFALGKKKITLTQTLNYPTVSHPYLFYCLYTRKRKCKCAVPPSQQLSINWPSFMMRAENVTHLRDNAI